MKIFHIIAFILLVIGGLNWLLVGALGWELGENLLGGQDSVLSKIVYILVGLSAIYLLVTHKHDCRACKVEGAASAGSSPMGGGSGM
jgi:uncharacterized protein